MTKSVTAYLTSSPVTGAYSYRRDIPVALREVIGKRHYRISLKTKQHRQAVIKASMLADEHDRVFAKLKLMASPKDGQRSPQRDYCDAIAWLKSNGYGADITPDTPDEVWEARMAHASLIDEQQDANAGEGSPSSSFDSLIRDGLRGKLGSIPMPSFSEAVVYYLREKNEKNPRREVDAKIKFQQATNRYADYLLAAMGQDKALDKLTRADGRDLIGFFAKKKVGAATVNKALRTVNTIFNYVNMEQELGLTNRLKGMNVDDPVDNEDKRRSFTMKEMRGYLTAGM